MKHHLIHKTMIAKVAKQLGPELCSQVAFLGGSTTSLHVTDPYIQEQVRGTEDVDIIISVLNKSNWYEFCDQLKQRSFKQNMNKTNSNRQWCDQAKKRGLSRVFLCQSLLQHIFKQLDHNATRAID